MLRGTILTKHYNVNLTTDVYMYACVYNVGIYAYIYIWGNMELIEVFAITTSTK